MKRTEAKPRLLVLLSDLHVGASTGLLPPNFVNFEGNEIKQNDYQKWLWDCWQDCWKWQKEVCGKDDWACAVNGDLIDGNHHLTREIFSPDVGDHVGGAIELLVDTLKPATAVFLTEGTNVHTQNSEHGIASVLAWNDVKVVKHNKQKSAWPTLDLVIAGTRVSIDHHVSSAMQTASESGAFSRVLSDMRSRRTRAQWSEPKFIVRSHRHQYGYFSDGYSSMVILPPWQGLSRFVHRVATGAVPQCGMVIADWRNVPDGEPPVIHTRIHTTKQPPAVYL